MIKDKVMASKKRDWVQGAVNKMKRKGTVGSLTRIAKRNGQTPEQYCASQKKRGFSSTKIQGKCQFMWNVNK